MSHPLQQFFSQVPLFSCLSADELNEILRAIQPTQLSAGALLFKEGDPADAAYVIQSGELEVFLERPDTNIELAVLGANDVLGEIALLDGQPRTAHVRAKSDVVLFRIERSEFDFLRRNLRPAAYKLIRQIATTLCDRVRISNQQIHKTVLERDDIASGRQEEREREAALAEEAEANKGVLNKLAFWRNR